MSVEEEVRDEASDLKPETETGGGLEKTDDAGT
jgi:hypothetical protein